MPKPTATSSSPEFPDAVVRAVANYRDVDSAALPPLYESVDPDALEALFAPLPDGSARGPGRVTFEYADCRVTVASDGTLHLE